MVQKIKKLQLLFTISLVGLLFNCQHEDVSEANHSHARQNNYNVKKISIDKLFTEERFAKAYNKIPKKKVKAIDLLGRSTIEDQFGFTILDNLVTVVEQEGKIYYTILVRSDGNTDGKLENLVLTSLPNQTEQPYIIKYNALATTQNPEQVSSLGIESVENLIDSQIINEASRCRTQIYETYVCSDKGGPGDCGGGDMTGDCHPVTVLVVSGCGSADPWGTSPGTSIGTSTSTSTGTGTGTSSSSGSSGSSGVSSPIIVTSPVTTSPHSFASQVSFLTLTLELNTSQVTFLQNNRAITGELYFFLQDYGNNTPEGRQFVKNLIDDITTPLVGDFPPNTPILDFPKAIIFDIEKYLECFDLTQPAAFTVYVDQPVSNSKKPNNGTNPGHSFISIKQGGIRRVVGFYPKTNVYPGLDDVDDGVLVDNSSHEFDVSISITITPSNLNHLISYIKDSAIKGYNLNTYNCTDFAMEASSLVGMSLGSAYGTWMGGAGDNPGQLGQNLRSLPLPYVGAVRNTTGGSSLSNMGSCP